MVDGKNRVLHCVPRAMLKTSGCALGFQHLPRNPANVDVYASFQNDTKNQLYSFNNFVTLFSLVF